MNLGIRTQRWVGSITDTIRFCVGKLALWILVPCPRRVYWGLVSKLVKGPAVRNDLTVWYLLVGDHGCVTDYESGVLRLFVWLVWVPFIGFGPILVFLCFVLTFPIPRYEGKTRLFRVRCAGLISHDWTLSSVWFLLSLWFLSYLRVLFFIIQSLIPLKDQLFQPLTCRGSPKDWDGSYIPKPQLEMFLPPQFPEWDPRWNINRDVIPLGSRLVVFSSKYLCLFCSHVLCSLILKTCS